MIATPAYTRELPTHLQTVDEFEAWQHEVGNDGSFEFVRGQIIPKLISQKKLAFVAFLLRKFVMTDQYQKGYVLMPAIDSYVSSTCKRVPNLAYFTAEQLTVMRQNERVKTLFAIEILSDSESHQDVIDKIQDYFDGGAQLVWYIVPLRQKIYAYTSPDDSVTFKEQQTISAAPLLPDFQFTVADLFA